MGDLALEVFFDQPVDIIKLMLILIEKCRYD